MTNFYFNFITDDLGVPKGKKQIQELTGFDASKFSCKQDEKRYGRDTVFAGGETNFSIYKRPEHHFDIMLLYWRKYGFEANVELIIETQGFEFIYYVDFAEMVVTYESISFKAVQNSKQILLKRRADVNVNLLSDKTLDGEDILPCIPENILIKAKPISGVSEWESTSQGATAFSNISYIGQAPSPTAPNTFKIRQGANNAQVVKKEGVRLTLSFISPEYALIPNLGGVPNNGDNFTYLEAEEDIFNATITIKDIIGASGQDINNTSGTGGLNPTIITSGSGYAKIQVRIGFDIENPATQVHDLYVKNYNYTRIGGFVPPTVMTPFPETVSTLVIPMIKRGQRIWIYVNVDANAVMEGPSFSTLARYSIFAPLVSWKIQITGTSVAYNTVNPAIRLYDAMKYICKSVSGMDIVAPDYEQNQKFWDQFIFTGNFLRGITDKGFNMSFEQLIKSITETNSDYQIQTDDTVLFASYPEFYRNEELMVIDQTQFDSFEEKRNPRYRVNRFNWKYKNYQSQKETEIENTIDVVHGETEWLLANLKVENKKEVEVDWVRDAFLIEETRKKAYDISDTAVSQDDDKKFILDCRMLTLAERTFKTTSFLQHTTVDNLLVLRNRSDFSFILLGIAIGDTFKISAGSPNQGNFTVTAVTGNSITLSPQAGSSITFTGEENTEFQYTVSTNTAKYTNWTNQGFSNIENIANPENFSNLRFTAKRNILTYFSQYLATANIHKKSKPIKNTLYKNNPDAITSDALLTAKEGEEFIPANPILDTLVHESIFLMDLKDYIMLENNIRNKRGFIRYIDAEETVRRGYPSKMEFTNRMYDKGVLEASLEVKYEPEILKIFSDNITGVIIINDFISVDKLDWNIDELGYLRIFDETGLLLFTKTLYENVSVNGQIFGTRLLLEQSLNNL